ncbi:hypothetical protein KS4_33590 [Poriferisphaera corsica]|uniref:Prepilin-type N-terminal cleavage/methylation domain-containing protein n=1 Tax=Poriferisphaera corsica TaxID=2528020 RepID=A0A517YYI3_9BACT|nr:type II secretion system protein [Poriferisphaera corsica]QDU35278.1 hypothetical protein KS4_33590 [Poriferisphaera corsica]
MKQKYRIGFTLIELLVVISIIGVLIGILMPALAMARGSAVSVKCKSNLRQIGTVMQSYLQDFEGYLPNAKFMPSPVASGDLREGLPSVMKNYLPLDREGKNAVYRCDGDDVLFDACGSSYMYEIMFRGKKVLEVTQAMRYWGEGFNDSDVWLMYDYEPGRVELEDGSKLEVSQFHRDENVVFADGHVEGFSESELEAMENEE